MISFWDQLFCWGCVICLSQMLMFLHRHWIHGWVGNANFALHRLCHVMIYPTLIVVLLSRFNGDFCICEVLWNGNFYVITWIYDLSILSSQEERLRATHFKRRSVIHPGIVQHFMLVINDYSVIGYIQHHVVVTHEWNASKYVAVKLTYTHSFQFEAHITSRDSDMDFSTALHFAFPICLTGSVTGWRDGHSKLHSIRMPDQWWSSSRVTCDNGRMVSIENIYCRRCQCCNFVDNWQIWCRTHSPNIMCVFILTIIWLIFIIFIFIIFWIINS